MDCSVYCPRPSCAARALPRTPVVVPESAVVPVEELPSFEEELDDEPVCFPSWLKMSEAMASATAFAVESPEMPEPLVLVIILVVWLTILPSESVTVVVSSMPLSVKVRLTGVVSRASLDEEPPPPPPGPEVLGDEDVEEDEDVDEEEVVEADAAIAWARVADEVVYDVVEETSCPELS